MKTFGLVLVAIIVPGGLVGLVAVGVRRWWRRYRVRTEIGKAPGGSYLAEWRAFHAGGPQIAPLNLPPVKPLHAQQVGRGRFRWTA